MESEIEYLPVYPDDFEEAAKKLHSRLNEGYMTFNVIARGAGPAIVERYVNNIELTDRESRFMDTITDEEVMMYVHEGELSFHGLLHSYRSGYIERIKFIGPKRLHIVRETLKMTGLKYDTQPAL